jgi:phytoene dehydrogenase-like protein
VVGSGPNGLAAAVTIAEAGRSVLVIEAADEPGGGLRTSELTLPGYRHDVCASVMALASLSPFMRRIGLPLVAPPAPLAHPLEGTSAAVLERSPAATARGLGADGPAYLRLFGRLVQRAPELFTDLLGPLRPFRHPLLAARFGLPGMLPAATVARAAFSGPRARALFAGVAAHSALALEEPVSAAVGMVLHLSAHHGGWPVARGGSASVVAALVRRLRDLGSEVRCGTRVDRLDRLPGSRAVVLDLTPKEILRVAGDRLAGRYGRALRAYRYGAGVFKVDWALDAPIPWRAAACSRAGTVHLGGELEEIATAESEVARGRHPERPFVLLVQPTLFDATRAPAGKHIAWAYCHVPNGSSVDMTAAIEAQVDRFAPGFRDLVRARSARGPADVERDNPNYVGGDVNGGRQDLGQLFTRPTARLDPYTTPDPGLFICSSATPPGGGVHGMCGWHAAQAVLRGPLR